MCVCVIEITVKIVEREQLGRSGVSPAFDTGPGGGRGEGSTTHTDYAPFLRICALILLLL